MAFSTIQGSGGAPDSFVGTTGVDALAVANSDGNFFVGANAGNDNIIISNTGAPLYAGVLSTSTIKGGDGRDALTIGTGANDSTFTNLFINGNGDRDNITFIDDDTTIASTIKGGAANDTIATSILTSSLVNGNKGIDEITISGAGGDESATSTVRGGGGDDTITTVQAFTDGLMAGDLGNDRLSVTAAVSVDGTTFEGGEGDDRIDISAAGAVGDEDISITGGAGSDVLIGQLNGESVIDGGDGVDTLDMSGGTATLIGGGGSDTLDMDAGAATALYNATSDFGAAGSAVSGVTVAAGDTIVDYTAGTDGFAIGSIVSGVGTDDEVAASGTAGNFNNDGVLVRTGVTAGTFTLGTSSYADLAAIVNAAINNDLTGDAGDVGIIQLQDDTGAVGGAINNTLTILVSLGSAAANRALNNTDSISLIAFAAGDVDAAANDFSFATA